MIPTSNVLDRTFLIRQGNSLGSAFSIEVDGREYLITARHVVANKPKSICALHNEKWKNLPVTGIYYHPGKPDVAAITLSHQIAPRHPVEFSLDEAVLGQNVAFLGFPFGWSNTGYDINDGYPIPFVKAAILSGIRLNNQVTTVYLDGHNNAGFSGGPIIADLVRDGVSTPSPMIMGVVSGFENEYTPHPSQIDPPPKKVRGYTIADDHVHLTNSGFIIGYGIEHAIEVAKANPEGFKLPPWGWD